MLATARSSPVVSVQLLLAVTYTQERINNSELGTRHIFDDIYNQIYSNKHEV